MFGVDGLKQFMVRMHYSQSGWAKLVSLDRQLAYEKENCDPKTRVDQARQPGKAVGPREEKLRFQTTRCYIEMPTTGLSSRACRALQCLEHNYLGLVLQTPHPLALG